MVFGQGSLEREKAIDKAWREAMKEEEKAWCKARKEREKAWNEANRKDKKAYMRIYYQNNKEKWKASKIYNEVRRKVKIASHKKWVNNFNKIRKSINRNIVFMRDGWICQICKKRVNKKLRLPNRMSASLDHIVPLSLGGIHAYSNVQLAHLRCNSRKQDNTLPQGEQLRLF